MVSAGWWQSGAETVHCGVDARLARDALRTMVWLLQLSQLNPSHKRTVQQRGSAAGRDTSTRFWPAGSYPPKAVDSRLSSGQHEALQVDSLTLSDPWAIAAFGGKLVERRSGAEPGLACVKGRSKVDAQTGVFHFGRRYQAVPDLPGVDGHREVDVQERARYTKNDGRGECEAKDNELGNTDRGGGLVISIQQIDRLQDDGAGQPVAKKMERQGLVDASMQTEEQVLGVTEVMALTKEFEDAPENMGKVFEGTMCQECDGCASPVMINGVLQDSEKDYDKEQVPVLSDKWIDDEFQEQEPEKVIEDKNMVRLFEGTVNQEYEECVLPVARK